MRSNIERIYGELQERLYKNFTEIIQRYVATATGIEDDTQNVAFGSAYPIFIPELVKEIMTLWVKAHDVMLNEGIYRKLAPDNPFMIHMKLHRGVTYEEFQMVLKATNFDTIPLDEKDYKYFRAYDFFKIHDKIDRKNFIIKNPYDKDNFDEYVRMLEQYQIPILNFFLTHKIPAYFPYTSLLKHAYLTGGSGSGKTELMKLIIHNLQKTTQKKHSASIVVFDPQGDFSRECLKFKLNVDTSRIIYVDLYIHKQLQEYKLIEPNEATYTPIINPFDIDERTIDAVGKMTVELAKAFEELLKDNTLTGNMEAFLHPCISTLLFRENSSIRDLQRFMQDGENADLKALGKQNKILDHQKFFTSGGFDMPLYRKTRDALYQKIQLMLNYPNFSRIMVGKSTIDLKKALNSGKVVLFNLSKGELTGVTSHAIGKILFAMIQGIGFRRVDIAKEKRKNTFIFVDEFQNFAISYVKNMLEEIRQYKMSFFMAQQYAGQGMIGDFLDSILTNTTFKIIGMNDPNSFGELSRSTGISEKQLKAIKKHQFFVFNRDANAKPEQKYFQIQTPSVLVGSKNTALYLNTDEYTRLLKYIVFQSGQYVKDKININTGETTTPTPQPQSNEYIEQKQAISSTQERPQEERQEKKQTQEASKKEKQNTPPPRPKLPF